MARTYIPTLLVLAHILAVYLTKNNAKIRANLTGIELQLYDALYNAIIAFDALSEALKEVGD